MVYTSVANPVRVEPSAKTKCLESDLVAWFYVQAVGKPRRRVYIHIEIIYTYVDAYVICIVTHMPCTSISVFQ